MPTEKAIFQAIIKVFSTESVLQHFDPDKKCSVKIDALDYVLTAVLSQPDYESALWPVAFMSCQYLLTKWNYGIYDKELLAIVQAFEE